ncbi:MULTISPECIES: DUF4097 family beta strand repeat-containing protein [Micromonospora]|nr:DUF4097 family beta strand repeat-containing protein [Micromonospora yangpuensis]GGM15938.1 hypothetical protein GCM10012279_37620 [Micromonospora yangpuensis]
MPRFQTARRPAVTARSKPRRVAAFGTIAALVLVTGCDGLASRRLDFDDTESARITGITVLRGAGDVTVRATDATTGVRIKRILRYQGANQPDTSYQIRGGELVLDTDCGNRCSLSYEVTAPVGVTVQGELEAGQLDLSRVGPVEITLGAGDVRISESNGPVRARTDAGDIEVDRITGPVFLRSGAGDVTGKALGTGAVDVVTEVGDISVSLDQVASARAHSETGSVTLSVPDGRYQVRHQGEPDEGDIEVPHDPGATAVLDVRVDNGQLKITRR